MEVVQRQNDRPRAIQVLTQDDDGAVLISELQVQRNLFSEALLESECAKFSGRELMRGGNHRRADGEYHERRDSHQHGRTLHG